MITPAKAWLRTYVKPVIVKYPRLNDFTRRCLAAYREFWRSPVSREQLLRELGQQWASANAERTFLLDQLAQYQRTVEQQQVNIVRITAGRDLDVDRSNGAEHTYAGTIPGIRREELPPARRLIDLIAAREDLTSTKVERLAAAVESFITNPASDRVGIHRDIGRALFERSAALYSGDGLPAYLERYTYPPVLSIALNSHCNAACFFCRPSDYKGSTVDFDNVFKLKSAIRHARTVDLTGWGEPFFYPRFEEVVNYITSVNDTKQLIQVTSNGSYLSERWARLLRGKLNKLIISINAATPDTYAEQMRYKGEQFTFERTVANIKEFSAQLTDEDRKRIYLHMVANTGNFREIVPLVRLAGNLGVPIVNIGNYICAQEEHIDKTLWNVKEEYNAEIAAGKALGAQLGVAVFGRHFFSSEKEAKGAENCVAPFEQFFVEMPGTTAPCCFMGAERMGNVYTDGFEAVWFSSVMNRLRANRFLPPCQVCTVFTPFDNKIAHMSAFLTTKESELVLGGGPPLGNRVTTSPTRKNAAGATQPASN
jgi:MoaA/NifB/PqqE/SkfB family radical SAM enzyme